MLNTKWFRIEWVILLLLSGCAQILSQDPAQSQVSPVVSEGETLIVGLSVAPGTLDPGDHRERQSETVIRNMFDGLVTRDTRNGIHLELAESIVWLDNITLEVKLRQDVLFHDGVEMTADDVVFTFERLINENAIDYPQPHTSRRKGLITPLESIQKVDQYTVRMQFNAPWPPALQLLVHQQIVPKHYLETVGTKGFLEYPIGTGPFRFVSADPILEEITLERFDQYYGGAPDLLPVGLACLQRVIFRVIPDTLTRVAALRAEEVDIIQAVPEDLITMLEESTEIIVRTAPGTRPVWMDMNTAQPPFDDFRVRQALNYAIDKERIIDEVFGGRAFVLPGPLSPFNNFVNENLDPYPYDWSNASALFNAAGWEDTDQDGLLDKDGNSFVFILDTLEVWRPLAEAIRTQFEEIGIEVILRYWDRSVIRPQALAGERMAYLDGWGDSAFDPVGHFEAKWHTFIEDEPYGRGNYSGYSNERVDVLIRQGEVSADPVLRQRYYDEAQEIIYVEAPAIFLVLPEVVEASSIRVSNWEPASDGRINLHDVCLIP